MDKPTFDTDNPGPVYTMPNKEKKPRSATNQSALITNNPSGPVYAIPNTIDTYDTEQDGKLGDTECQIPANSKCVHEYETQFGLMEMGHVNIYTLDTSEGFNEVGSADEVQPYSILQHFTSTDKQKTVVPSGYSHLQHC